jgi:gas vesicle protein
MDRKRPDRNSAEISTAGWLIGGAALGALAMFLADPERGQTRRAVAASKLNDALSDTRDYLGTKTSDLSGRFKERTDDLTDRVKATASDLSSRAKKTNDAGERRSDWRQDYGHPVARSTIRLGGESYWEKAVGRELWMIGGAILGAIGMYLADPDMGTHRRTTAGNKLRNLTPGKNGDTSLAASGEEAGDSPVGGVAGTGTISDNDQPQGNDPVATRH